MDVQWFPGHMAKAKREIAANLPLVDLVLEVRDARIPESSRNPDLSRLIGNKNRIVLLNKNDLADLSATARWQDWFGRNGMDTLPVDARSGAGFDRLTAVLRERSRIMRDVMKSRGRLPRNLRLLILGIPNVGKSTVINRLAGRKAARTGDMPGITRGKQWISLPGELELLDSPGLLPPKIGDPVTGLHLALIGTIREELVSIEDLAHELLSVLAESYPAGLRDRYGELCAPEEEPGLLGSIAQKKGCLQSGGRPDYMRAARLVLDDFRSGKMGRITLERPPR